MIDALLGNQALILFPFLIIVNLIVGVIAAIKSKKFDMSKVPDFIVKAVFFFIFIIVLDYVNSIFTTNSMGDIAVAGIQTLRGLAWLAIVIYYISKIYKNLVYIGMPRFQKVEDEIKANDSINDVTVSMSKKKTKKQKHTPCTCDQCTKANEEGE